jgi:hypothetical protein
MNGHTVALIHLQQMFANGNVRAHPVESDRMEPSLFKGEFVGITPIDHFHGDDIYLVSNHGYPEIYRCQSNFRGGIDLRQDRSGDLVIATIPHADFADLVLGRVIAVCGYINRFDRRAA